MKSGLYKKIMHQTFITYHWTRTKVNAIFVSIDQSYGYIISATLLIVIVINEYLIKIEKKHCIFFSHLCQCANVC